MSSSEYSTLTFYHLAHYQMNPVKKTLLSPLTLQNLLSPLEGCTSINILLSSIWKVPLNLSCLFYFSLYDCINKQVPSAFNVSVVSTLGGNIPQYVPATESKLTLFPKTTVYSSSLSAHRPQRNEAGERVSSRMHNLSKSNGK